ncbi:MAG TPA: hypothetical protein PKD16_01490 [Saprospiraceae bacterium]|jgi:hypothetical protein|nr:hypothetical protein [Saprospiraceae bacterium]
MLILVFTLLSAIYDKGKRFEDHKLRFIFRAVIVALISLIGADSMYEYIVNFAFNTAIFYALFDYILNILECRDWNYIGSTATIDKITNKYGDWKIQLLFKILLITVTFILKFKTI